MEPFVTVHRSRGPLIAEIARDLLEDAGVSSQVVEAGGETCVAVPARAREKAEVVLAANAEMLAPDEAEPAAPKKLRHLLAAGVTPICPVVW